MKIFFYNLGTRDVDTKFMWQPPPAPEKKYLCPASTCSKHLKKNLVGCFGFNGSLRQTVSVCIGPSPKEREKEERKDGRE